MEEHQSFNLKIHRYKVHSELSIFFPFITLACKGLLNNLQALYLLLTTQSLRYNKIMHYIIIKNCGGSVIAWEWFTGDSVCVKDILPEKDITPISLEGPSLYHCSLVST
jgi:hypothetical protein